MDVPTAIDAIPDSQQATNAVGASDVASIASDPRGASTDCKRQDQGPDYKHQCRSFVPTQNSPLVTTEPPDNQETTIRCSNASSSATNRSYIPCVCGVPLPEDQHVIGTQLEPPNVIQSTTLVTTNALNLCPRESEEQTGHYSPEQAPVPQFISLKRDSFERMSPTLSNAEKRYWIKVVVIAIIVNTLIVLGGVIGGVCGISGCTFSDDPNIGTAPVVGNNVPDVNATDSPTPSPSRRLVASDSPFGVGVTITAPTIVPANDLAESLDFPSISPVATSPPTMSSTADEDASTLAPGMKLIVILPIALLVDAILIIVYLYYHYSRWIRRKQEGLSSGNKRNW